MPTLLSRAALAAAAVALAQGYAKGTVFALNNPEAAIRILWEVFPQTRSPGKSEADALRCYCLLVLNANEFVYLD